MSDYGRMIISQQNITLITAIIGAVCGVAGAIMGIINTWHQLNRSKLRLKVIPKNVIPVGAMANSMINFGIEVVNLSEFPVTISDVGFLLLDKKRVTFCRVDSIDQPGKLPMRLEPRTTYTKYFNLEKAGFPKYVEYAYADTQCGELITGTSGALKQKIKEVSA